MKEYYADVLITNEIEEWLLLQGARAYKSNRLPVCNHRTGKEEVEIDVYFGHRKIHYYTDSKEVKIFFNDENKSVGLMMLIKWPDKITKHNIPKE